MQEDRAPAEADSEDAHEETHTCGVCGTEFASEAELEKHVREQGLVE
jgi:hypothetical protein